MLIIKKESSGDLVIQRVRYQVPNSEVQSLIGELRSLIKNKKTIIKKKV